VRQRGYSSSPQIVFGICVGYQALFNKSEEFNSNMPGLGVFEGTVVKFSETHGLKSHKSAGTVWKRSGRPARCSRCAEGSYAYFVHSFYPKPCDSSIIASQTSYGEFFASQSGGTMFMPPSSIPKRVSSLDCSC
jgi:glutamine amidotransferase